MQNRYFTSDELYHYGVAGMKWKHHKYTSKEDKNKKARTKETIKKVATAGAIAGGVIAAGSAAYLLLKNKQKSKELLSLPYKKLKGRPKGSLNKKTLETASELQELFKMKNSDVKDWSDKGIFIMKKYGMIN